ncbi:MAG: ion transporter [Proteobacteria bacterium]|nr:ion transporter [Pseudomonadota bacterium]
MSSSGPARRARWRLRLHQIIFEADTPGGKVFDVVLLLTIVISLIAVMLESVEAIDRRYHSTLRSLDLVITALFTVEYVLRLICVVRPLRYATSFFGVVDLLAILPGYASLFFAGTQSLLVIRGLRLLRVFRVFKLSHYLGEARVLVTALRASKNKITVFLASVVIVTVNMGALMYLIEGDEAGFTSIPRGVYWAVVTMTTVGYGDIAPQSPLGQAISAVLMVSGYGIIAVPTGIVTVELANARQAITTRVCQDCAQEGHDSDATYCKFCGAKL